MFDQRAHDELGKFCAATGGLTRKVLAMFWTWTVRENLFPETRGTRPSDFAAGFVVQFWLQLKLTRLALRSDSIFSRSRSIFNFSSSRFSFDWSARSFSSSEMRCS